jgi:ribosomal protein S18 acetylase RimI-like enzyme
VQQDYQEFLKSKAMKVSGESRTEPVLIYCASGNKRYMDIALANGFKCGGQLPGTIYHALYFADQNYHHPNFDAYMAALEKECPYMATVIDWESHISLDEVIRWANCASQFVQDTVIIIPKICGTIPDIPHEINGKNVRLGYSIPTTHGGTEVPMWEFKGRDVHLLGGSPQKQIENMRYLGSDVKSADGNYLSEMASHNNQFYVNGSAKDAKNRYAPQLKEVGLGHIEKDAPYAAFELSCINFRLAVQTGATVGVRWAVEADIPAIEKIARQFKSELGFVMRVKLKQQIEKRELYIAEYGREIVGFVNWHRCRDGVSTVYEIAVAKHRQGERIGAALLESVPKPIRLKCTVDNQKANDFYEDFGMTLLRVEEGRKRPLNIWYI